MQVNRLLTTLLTGHWLIEHSTAESHLPLLERFLSGQSLQDITDSKPDSPVSAVAFSDNQMSSFSSYDDAPEGSVAVINLSGVMMREDSCFSYGTDSLARLTQEAYNHPNISAIVKVISSGGGQVNGTEAYAAVVGASPKPVVTYVKGMMASAAFWVGSKAQHIMLEGRTTMVGSIGTQLTIQDRTAQLAKEGIKLHIIRPEESYNKNETSLQAIAGNYAPIIEEQLKPLNNVFMADVLAARAGKLEAGSEALTGKMFVGQGAIDAGLADSFGTLQDAINMAIELATISKENNPKTDMSLFGSKKYAALTALAIAAEAISAEQLTAANEELLNEGITGAMLVPVEELNTLRATAESVEALNSENGQLRTEAEGYNARITELEAQLETANATISRLDGEPGADHTNPKADGTEIIEDQKPARAIDAEAELISQFKIK